MNDTAFLEAFERLELPAAGFHHREHLRAAWTCLDRDGFAPGAARFVAALRRFVAHIGAGAKYHETITWFFLLTLQQRIESGTPAGTWERFIAQNADLADAHALLGRHYSSGVLASARARGTFVWPDRLAGAGRLAADVNVGPSLLLAPDDLGDAGVHRGGER